MMGIKPEFLEKNKIVFFVKEKKVLEKNTHTHTDDIETLMIVSFLCFFDSFSFPYNRNDDDDDDYDNDNGY